MIVSNFTSVIRYFKRFLHSRWQQKAHILVIALLAGLARFASLCFPYRWYRGVLGPISPGVDYCSITTPEKIALAYRSGRLIENVCEKVPWQARCLVQTMVFCVYARHYKIPYTVLLGAAKAASSSNATLTLSSTTDSSTTELDAQLNAFPSDDPSAWMAHAWVRVAGIVAIGEGEGDLNAFKILASHRYLC